MVCGMHMRVVFLEDYVAVSRMGKCCEHTHMLEATDSQLGRTGPVRPCWRNEELSFSC